jgi:hypothetical protein
MIAGTYSELGYLSPARPIIPLPSAGAPHNIALAPQVRRNPNVET